MQTYPPGTRIGQYEIASLPMKGGMGVVYFALDHGNDGRPVALKTFRPELLPDRAARDRFLREGTAWIELGSHPHIVRCYKVEYIDPTAFLVLELIAKEQNMPDASLRSWLIPGRPLSLEQALLFALQIARGMQSATEKIPGFVHRDLKPENILVGTDKLPGTNINRLRVTDFGLVKTIADGDMPTKAGGEEEIKPNQVQFTRGVGTPLYMAPEQWIGEPVGVFTDVYAFGCILYEMLTGQRPADGQTITELQIAHCEGKLRPINLALPSDVNTLLSKCIELDPTKRYGHWSELTEIIELVYSLQSRTPTPHLADYNKLSQENQMQVSSSYVAIGQAYMDIGETEKAIDCFTKIVSIMREIKDRNGEGVAVGNLGNAHFLLGEARLALGFYEYELNIARQTGNQYEESAALMGQGSAYIALGKTQQAIELLDESFNLFRKIGSLRGELKAQANLGDAYQNLGLHSKAIKYYQNSLAVARQLGDQRMEGSLLGSLGIAYLKTGDIQQAIICHNKRIAIARSIGDRLGESNGLGNLGSAYLTLGEAQKAIEYFRQALVIDNEIGDKRGLGADLSNLGSANLAFGNIPAAIEQLKQAQVIQHEIGNRHEEGITLQNIGKAYKALGDVPQAIHYYERSLNLARDIDDMDGTASGLFNLALIYSKQGEIAHAILLAQESLQIFTQINNPNAATAQKLVSQLQEKAQSSMKDDSLMKALAAFIDSDSLLSMQATVIKYPLLKDQQTIEKIEIFIREQVKPEDIPAFQRRLDWLKQLANKREVPPVSNRETSVQDAFKGFQEAISLDEMRTVASKYPLVLHKQFIQAIEEIINEQVSSEHKPAFEQRLDWLKQLAEK